MDDHITHELPSLVREAQPTTKPPRRSLWLRLAWGVVLLAVLGGVAWIVLRPHAVPQAAGGRFGGGGPMPVVTAAAVKGDMPVTLNALGTVTPLATVTVRTQINGQLLQVGFTEGQ